MMSNLFLPKSKNINDTKLQVTTKCKLIGCLILGNLIFLLSSGSSNIFADENKSHNFINYTPTNALVDLKSKITYNSYAYDNNFYFQSNVHLIHSSIASISVLPVYLFRHYSLALAALSATGALGYLILAGKDLHIPYLQSSLPDHSSSSNSKSFSNSDKEPTFNHDPQQQKSLPVADLYESQESSSVSQKKPIKQIKHYPWLSSNPFVELKANNSSASSVSQSHTQPATASHSELSLDHFLTELSDNLENFKIQYYLLNKKRQMELDKLDHNLSVKIESSSYFLDHKDQLINLKDILISSIESNQLINPSQPQIAKRYNLEKDPIIFSNNSVNFNQIAGRFVVLRKSLEILSSYIPKSESDELSKTLLTINNYYVKDVLKYLDLIIDQLYRMDHILGWYYKTIVPEDFKNLVTSNGNELFTIELESYQQFLSIDKITALIIDYINNINTEQVLSEADSFKISSSVTEKDRKPIDYLVLAAAVFSNNLKSFQINHKTFKGLNKLKNNKNDQFFIDVDNLYHFSPEHSDLLTNKLQYIQKYISENSDYHHQEIYAQAYIAWTTMDKSDQKKLIEGRFSKDFYYITNDNNQHEILRASSLLLYLSTQLEKINTLRLYNDHLSNRTKDLDFKELSEYETQWRSLEFITSASESQLNKLWLWSNPDRQLMLDDVNIKNCYSYNELCLIFDLSQISNKSKKITKQSSFNDLMDSLKQIQQFIIDNISAYKSQKTTEVLTKVLDNMSTDLKEFVSNPFIELTNLEIDELEMDSLDKIYLYLDQLTDYLDLFQQDLKQSNFKNLSNQIKSMYKNLKEAEMSYFEVVSEYENLAKYSYENPYVKAFPYLLMIKNIDDKFEGLVE